MCIEYIVGILGSLPVLMAWPYYPSIWLMFLSESVEQQRRENRNPENLDAWLNQRQSYQPSVVHSTDGSCCSLACPDDNRLKYLGMGWWLAREVAGHAWTRRGWRSWFWRWGREVCNLDHCMYMRECDYSVFPRPCMDRSLWCLVYC